MKRKMVAVLLAMSLVSLTACSSTGSNAKQTQKESVSTENVAETEQEEVKEENVVEEEKEPEMETVYLVSKYKVFSNWGEEAEVEYTQYTYDEFGNELTVETRAEDGTLTSSSSKEYDENGYLVKMIYVNEDGESITTYENNENGDVIKSVSDSQIRTYEYDENGTLRKSAYYNEFGEIYILIVYNEQGDEIFEKYVISEELALETTFTNEYGDNGNLIKVIKKSSDGTGSTEEITEYEYDTDNNRIKEITNEGQFVTTREYDANKNLTKVINEYYGEVDIWEYEYDENGNQVKTVSYDANGAIEYQIESEYISMELPKED